MDKYEYRVKTEQMLAYMENKQYKEAMEIADTIDWRRVKNSAMLSTVSEIYECNGENEKSRDILFIAYDRSPGSRKVVYRLGVLSVKLNNLQEAMDCYEEFISLAPKDPNQYILKYKILRAQESPIEQQIEALVDFKKVEYVEKWAYELARLYHEAGLITECLEECDDLILWFSEGKYVFQAMQLKMQHKPLTPLQQEKYNQCIEEQNKEMFRKALEKQKEEEAKAAAEAEEASEESVQPKPEEAVGEGVYSEQEGIARESVQPESEEAVGENVYTEQEGIAGESVYTEQEGIAGEDVYTEQEAITGEEVQRQGTAMEAEAEPEVIPTPEEQIPAHEKIEGILQDWEEKQRAVEQEIEEKRRQAEAEKAEREAKRRELEEQNKFNNTMPIIPDDIQKLLEDLENGILDDEEKEEPEQAAEEEAVDQEVFEEEAAEPSEFAETEASAEEEAAAEEASALEEPEQEPEQEQAVVQPQEPEIVKDFEEDDDIIAEEYEIPSSETTKLPNLEEEKKEEPKEEKSVLERLEERFQPESAKSPEGVSFDTGFVVQGRYDLEAQSEIGLKAGLTEEQKKLFSYFVPVRGMSEQIVEVLENDKKCKTRYGTSRTGNILIVGRQGTGKTVLAVNVVKAIQKIRKLKQGKIAIVTGEALNKKDLSSILGKLKGGALIIEKAGRMNTKTIRKLNELMEEQTGELLIVLEEQRRPLEKILAANADFKRKFTSKIELPVFINDELVTFGQTYAKENGYKIDEMGILALYSRIDLQQKEDHAVTVAEVKDIMDEAIERAQRANVKHFMKRMFGKRTDSSDRVILTEHDFK